MNQTDRLRVIDVVCLIFAAFFTACAFCVILNDGSPASVDFLEQIKPSDFAVYFACAFGVFAICRALLRKTGASLLILLFSAVLYGFCVIIRSPKNFYLSLTVTIILWGFIYYISESRELRALPRLRLNLSGWTLTAAVVALFLISASYLSVQTIMRYRVYDASNYDFGIFTQMFHNMKTTGLPITSCERAGMDSLANFAVHFSPIFYLFLPGYYIFPRPEYMLIVQAVFVCACVLPLALICGRLKLSNWLTLLLCVVFVIYPATFSGVFWDFHENKFLTFFLLWFIYFTCSGKTAPAYISAALVLMIKEDAALYILIMALYMIIAQKKYKHGLILACLSLVYFTAVIGFMEKYGLLLMKSHYAVYFGKGDDGILALAANCFLNPAIVLKYLLKAEKLEYLVYTFAPLMFLPLLNKSPRNLILLIPIVVMNLIPEYRYQYLIGYQYFYGQAALMFYASATNLEWLTRSKRHGLHAARIAACCLIAAMIFAHTGLQNKLFHYSNLYNNNIERYTSMDKLLETIPKDASVTSSTFILPHLADRRYVFMIPYDIKELDLELDLKKEAASDYYVFDIRYDDKSGRIDAQSLLERSGYYLLGEAGYVQLYGKYVQGK